MELLSQRKVHALKQEENRLAIQKGMDLANRIDSLRQISLQEEKSLMDQRDAIISSLTKDANNLNQAIAEAKGELEKIQEQRRESLKPITEQWQELRNAQKAFNEEVVGFEAEKSDLNSLERSLSLKMDKADENLDLIRERDIESVKLHRRRQLQIEEVQRITTKLNSDIDAFNRSRDAFVSQHSERERRLQIREREHLIKVENFNKREADFNTKYVSITSNYRQ